MENKKSNSKLLCFFYGAMAGAVLTAGAVYINSQFTIPNSQSSSETYSANSVDTLTSCVTDCPCICTDYSGSEPFHLIDGRLLREMAHNFQVTRNEINIASCLTRSRFPDSDAASVWFALDTLKRFIWEIENRTCNCQEVSNLGVRIYYARYPDPMDHSRFPDLDGVRDEYVLMHTVFMVPTFDKRGGNSDTHYDFDLSSTPFCPPNVINSTDTVIVGLMGGRNHGTLCPPICGDDGTLSGDDGVSFGR